MQKSPRFFDALQIKSQKVLTEITNDNFDISFEKLLQKTDQNISTSFDNVFKTIQLGEQKSMSSVYNKNKENNKNQNRCNSCSGSKSDKIEQMVENSKLKMTNKKLEYELGVIKQKYKKGIQEIEENQNQQIKRIKKQNDEIKRKLHLHEEQRQKQKKKQNKIYEQLKLKYHKIEKELKSIKNQHNKQLKQKEQYKIKYKNLQSKVQQLEEMAGQLQKKLRIKEKQMIKMEQFQAERSQYYENIFHEKGNIIEKIKIEYAQRTQQILQQNQINQNKLNQIYKQVETLLLQKKSLSEELEVKKVLMERAGSMINQSICLLQEHLKQLTTGSNYSTRSTKFEKSHKKNKDMTEEINLKLLSSLIMEVIQKNNSIRNQNSLQFQNFKEKYEGEINDLDKKITFLVQQNRHLKIQKDGLKHNFQSNLTSNFTSNRSQKDIFNQVQQKQLYDEVKKLKKNIKQVKKHRQINSQSLKEFRMTSNQKIYQPNKFIKDLTQKQYENLQNCRIKQQIQKAKQVFNEVMLHNRTFSVQNLRNSQRNQSEGILHRRSRQSLSWKKPSPILKQYI